MDGNVMSQKQERDIMVNNVRFTVLVGSEYED
jgi:hypothetical protein